MVEIYYYGLKIAVFLAILRAYLKFEPLQTHAVFLAAVYTAGVAFISWVFLLAPQQPVVVWPRYWENRMVYLLLGGANTAPNVLGWRAWQIWLVETFGLMTIYLKLLRRFEDGGAFWIVLVLGLGLILF